MRLGGLLRLRGERGLVGGSGERVGGNSGRVRENGQGVTLTRGVVGGLE